MVPTIMILFANSHNFSWINFSLALNTPLRGNEWERYNTKARCNDIYNLKFANFCWR